MTGVALPYHGPRRRRRGKPLPFELLIPDGVALALLILLPAAVIWILGGNRAWIMMPMVLATVLAGEFFLWRFLVSSRRNTFSVPPGGLTVFVFLIFVGLRAPWSDIPYEAGEQTFKFLSYVLAYWMWFNLLRYNKRWKPALVIVMVSVSIMAWYAMIQEVQGTRMAVLVERHDDYGMRASGAYVCPNHFAHLLHMLILVSISLLAASGVGLPLKLFAGYTAAVCLYPLFLTLSRSGWIGLMLGLVVFAVTMAWRKGAKSFLVVLFLAPLVVGGLGAIVWKISPQVQMRVQQAIQGDVRIPMWQDSLEIAKDAPWFGHGLGSYRYIYPSYHNKMTLNRDPEFAHNDYLHFWTEIGLVGLFLAAALSCLIVARALRVIHIRRDKDAAVLMCGLLAMMAGTLAHAFFDFNLNIFGNVHVYVFLIAALMAATDDDGADRVVDVRSGRFKVAGIILMIMLAGVAMLFLRRGMSYKHEVMGESYAMSEKWPEADKSLERALLWQPDNWRAQLLMAHSKRQQAFWMRRPDARAELIESAGRYYALAEQGNPWLGEIWFGRGLLARISGNPEEALALLREAVKRAPRYPSHLNELGQQLRLMKRYDEAIEVFRMSLKYEPTPMAQKNIEIIERWIAKRDEAGRPAN